MTDRARIGVTGAGELGRHLADGFASSEGASLVAVADVSRTARERAGAAFGLPADALYADHEAMVTDAGLDGVAVATPHARHYEQVAAALDRGVAVLCEKPLCVDVERARELARRSRDADATLMVGYQRHLDPAFVRAREALAARVGEPTFVAAEITQDWLAGVRGTWRTDPDVSGGGMLSDTGGHVLDAVLWVTGLAPAAVNARMAFADAAERVDASAALNVTFENGATGSIAVSGEAPRVREHLHVWGEEGACYVEGVGWDDRTLRFVDGESGDEYRPRLDRWDAESKPEAFARIVREGGTPPATADDALAVTALTEAAYESARSGETVRLTR